MDDKKEEYKSISHHDMMNMVINNIVLIFGTRDSGKTQCANNIISKIKDNHSNYDIVSLDHNITENDLDEYIKKLISYDKSSDVNSVLLLDDIPKSMLEDKKLLLLFLMHKLCNSTIIITTSIEFHLIPSIIHTCSRYVIQTGSNVFGAAPS